MDDQTFLFPQPHQGAYDRTVYDPFKTEYKDPFGAVCCGAKVSFTLRTEPEVTAVSMLIFREFADVHEILPLTAAGEENGRRLYRAYYTAPDAPELVWYFFRLETADGAQELSCGSEPFQLTVYEAANHWPDWYGEGVSYQIFPDRFRRTHISDASKMVGKRQVHTDWNAPMLYEARQEEPQWCYDFYGGNLRGITEKLDYLQSLSVGTLYLCPIFESSSNHRYNTADYRRIDPMLGNEADFRLLCAEAHKRGIRVMLDGVFNHSGHDSRYFNALGFYDEPGAAQSKDSPYYPWYHFQRWPDLYDAWWGIPSMPAANELNDSYADFIVRGEDSVVRHWLRLGADAWRLDVADELPDEFIAMIRSAMEEEKPDSFLLGEVWEDGSNKIAYSRRRRYLLGRECHGLMNYPFRRAALEYLRGGDAADFFDSMETLREHYPPKTFYSLMNFLSTHDTPRMLTLLGVRPEDSPEEKADRAAFRLSAEQRTLAEERLRLGVLLLYCFPGSPLLYYGDEAGMEGFEDPFNRGTYPWGGEDPDLLQFHRKAGALRSSRVSLRKGDLRYVTAAEHILAFTRSFEGETTLLALNAGDTAVTLALPWGGSLAEDALSRQRFFARNGAVTLTLPPREGVVLI